MVLDQESDVFFFFPLSLHAPVSFARRRVYAAALHTRRLHINTASLCSFFQPWSLGGAVRGSFLQLKSVSHLYAFRFPPSPSFSRPFHYYDIIYLASCFPKPLFCFAEPFCSFFPLTLRGVRRSKTQCGARRPRRCLPTMTTPTSSCSTSSLAGGRSQHRKDRLIFTNQTLKSPC